MQFFVYLRCIYSLCVCFTSLRYPKPHYYEDVILAIYRKYKHLSDLADLKKQRVTTVACVRM